MSKTNNQTRNTLLSLLSAIFLFAQPIARALPSTGAANLQATAGVTTAVSGGTLSITAPNKAILSWQNFGGGNDTISASDTLSYTLPSTSSAVLNIVSGAARTQIDGTLISNGNVFVLNPSGIVLGGGSRIDTNQLVLSTSDNIAFAGYYFQTNGKLPSQDGLVPAAGNIAIGGAIVNTVNGLELVAKNIDLGGLINQGNLILNSDGLVNLGNSGTTYITGNVTITNTAGTTVLGSSGNILSVSGNIVLNSTSGAVLVNPNSVLNARALTVNGGNATDVNIGRINSSTVAITGNNINVAFGSAGAVTFNGTAAGNTTVTAQSALTADVRNSGTGNTTVTTTGPLTLGKIHNDSTGTTAFTGTSVLDSVNDVFVYGATTFAATTGNISITRDNHSFGPITAVTTGEVTIRENGALNLNNVQAAKLTAQTNAYVFQTTGAAVINTPVANVTAVTDASLGSLSNAIGNLTLTVGGNATVANTGALTLGNIFVPGTLSVTTTNAITQVADTKVVSHGATAFTGNSITLGNAGNQFGGISLDATVAGNVSVSEDTTLNVVSLRAANANLKSLASVITSGNTQVLADNYSIIAGADFIPAANFKATNSLTVMAGKTVDLSLLSLATNLNAKAPSVIALGYRAPTP